jgi:hypothetical protein
MERRGKMSKPGFRKGNVMLVLAGVVLLALELVVNVGSIKVDLFNDIAAYVLIIIGLMGMAGRSNIFRKNRGVAVGGLFAALFTQLVYCLDMGEYQFSGELFARGICTILYIYVTYYFMEGVALEAKMQGKTAVSQNFRVTWIVFGVLVFAYYVVLNLDVPSVVEIVVQAVMVICAVYYCVVMAGACNQLYMEGQPPRSDR